MHLSTYTRDKIRINKEVGHIIISDLIRLRAS